MKRYGARRASRPGRVRLVALAAIVALVGAACQEKLEPDRDVVETAPSQIRDLLDRREDFLLKGNARGFLKNVVGEARTVEGKIVRQGSKLPLKEVAYRLLESVVAQELGRVTNQRVDLVFRLKGFPRDNIFHLPLLYDFERRGTRWVITKSDFDKATQRQVWIFATGPIELTHSKNFLALHRPDVQDVDDILQSAETARRQLKQKLSRPLDSRFLVVLANNQDDFRKFSVGEAVAAAIYEVYEQLSERGIEQAQPPQNRHMVIDLTSVLYSPFDLVDWEHTGEKATPIGVFQHETAHLAVSRLTGGFAPNWMVEGAAMYLAGESRRPEWERRLPLGSDGGYDDIDLERLSRQPRGRLRDYSYANAVTSYLIDKFGEKKWWKLYQGFLKFDFAGYKTDEAVRSDRTHQLLQQIYNLDEDRLHQRTLRWMEQEVQAR